MAKKGGNMGFEEGREKPLVQFGLVWYL